tara:strand:+ start:143 stop:595 length:453 start_codon:yes stop_codon:yes gene_type:complete
MTDVTKNTGTTVGISAVLPTTYDADGSTGYASLTFIDIGEVVDISELSKTYTAISHQPVGQEYPDKIKDIFDIDDITITMGKVTANTGQAAIQTALGSANSVAFKVTLPSGDYANFTGKVMKAGIGGISSGSISTTSVNIAVDPETLFEA